MGIGTSAPTAMLSVNGSMNVNTYTNEALDQSQPVGDHQWNGNTNWQSFTAGVTGYLTEVDFYLDSPYAASDGTGVLRIYSGEGTAGTLLTQQSILISNAAEMKFYPVANPPKVTAGQVYTAAITVPGYDQMWFETQSGNLYSGGRFGNDSAQDALFKTWVSAATGGGLMVTSGGNVGIGHSNPACPLTFAAEYGDKIAIYGNTGDHIGLGAQANLLQIYGSSTDDAIAFGYGKSDSFTENMRIAGNGNVGIGTTTPKCALHVAGSGWFCADSGSLGTAAGQGMRVFMDSGASPVIGRIISYDYASGGGSLNLTLQHTGGYVGIGNITPAYKLQLASDSAAKPNGGSWTNPSDFRLKKNIRPFADGLDTVRKINPVRYQYNGLAQMPADMECIGVIAQDMKAVAPYTVGTFRAKLDEKAESETELYDFNASALTFVMINAIKELDAKVNGGGAAGEDEKPEGSKETAEELMAKKLSRREILSTADQTAVPGAELFPVCEAVEFGDVLVTNPAQPGTYCLGRQAVDPGVFGVVSAGALPSKRKSSEESYGQVPVAMSGIVYCKVDAAYGPVKVNDLLCTSATPGHAMKLVDPKFGVIIGKALEPLESGTGLIKVLVMLR